MTTRSAKLKELLGMSHGAAANRLRKSVMFELVRQLGKNMCHQCGKPIDEEKSFSIEHKVAWQSAEDPRDAFFNLNNIAFSHLSCNIKAGEGCKKLKPRPNYKLGRETVAKLTKEQATEVKRLLNQGMLSQRAIARMYKLHHSSIQSIANGVSWQDA